MTLYAWAWINAVNNSPNGTANITHRVDGIPRGTTVFANIALSAYSGGVSVSASSLGAAGCIIRAWETFNPNGSVNEFSNLALSGNSMYIANCASVTFELTVTYANAYAMGTVYFL